MYRTKASSYNTVETKYIINYIKRYNREITELLEDEKAMQNTDRTTLKSIAADLETSVRRLNNTR